MKLFEANTEHGIFHGFIDLRENKPLNIKDKTNKANKQPFWSNGNVRKDL